MVVARASWRPLIFGLAAPLVFTRAGAPSMPPAQRMAQCGGCQGEDGNSSLEKIPSLAGQPAFFVMNQLFLMRENVRRIEAMMSFVKDIKDEERTELSQHYAALEPKPSGEGIDPALAERGAAIAQSRRCGSCPLPTLAGQDQ